MTSVKDKAHKYFTIILAALIAVEITIAGVIYSLFYTTPEDLTDDAFPHVNPTSDVLPDHPPYVPPPETPPPGL